MDTITLFHGAIKEYTVFEIDEKLARHNFDTLVEGYGIYFSESKSFAESYGDYIYEVEIKKSDITDFTRAETFVSLIKQMEKDTNIPISEHLDMKSLEKQVLNGGISVTTLYEEINKILINTSSFIEEYSEIDEDEDETFLKDLIKSYEVYTKNIIRYFDRSFDCPIYVCKREPENIVITSVTHNS